MNLTFLIGIRPGLGDEHHYCDCTASDKLSNHFVTLLVSVQYLSLLCMKYCAVVTGLRKWRPEYMPLSTTSTSTTTTTTALTTTTGAPTTTVTTILNSLQIWDDSTPRDVKSEAFTNPFKLLREAFQFNENAGQFFFLGRLLLLLINQNGLK